ncbi:MAG: class I SAM-dependent methyltransferase [Deltaproteobacteria bacterium]|nr:class I SAM-dependent methyltransferase [Deltaproteobacteria bacterium]
MAAAGCARHLRRQVRPREAVRAHPDVPADRIVRPAIVCDAATLDGLASDAYDFLIACHLLEHAHDPIAALLAWHRVLKPGGRALCIVPDARFTFDRGRPRPSACRARSTRRKSSPRARNADSRHGAGRHSVRDAGRRPGSEHRRRTSADRRRRPRTAASATCRSTSGTPRGRSCRRRRSRPARLTSRCCRCR